MKKMLTLLLSSICALLPSCNHSENGKADPQVFIDLRKMLWEINPDSLQIQIDSTSPYCVILDFGIGSKDFASLVMIKEGTVSLYFSNGGGIIGCGQYDDVRQLSTNVIEQSNQIIDFVHPASSFMPLSANNASRFYIFTKSGKFASDEFLPAASGNAQKPIMNLFAASNEVITAIRKIK